MRERVGVKMLKNIFLIIQIGVKNNYTNLEIFMIYTISIYT